MLVKQCLRDLGAVVARAGLHDLLQLPLHALRALRVHVRAQHFAKPGELLLYGARQVLRDRQRDGLNEPVNLAAHRVKRGLIAAVLNQRGADVQHSPHGDLQVLAARYALPRGVHGGAVDGELVDREVRIAKHHWWCRCRSAGSVRGSVAGAGRGVSVPGLAVGD